MDELAAIAVFVIGAFFCGVVIGGCAYTESQRNQAIEAGVGRWVIDAKTGDSSFVYGVPKAIPAK